MRRIDKVGVWMVLLFLPTVLWTAPSLPVDFSSSQPVNDDRARAYYFYSLAQQAQFQRNFFDALRYLEEAIQFDDSVGLNTELAEFHSSLNQFVPAERHARRALELDSSSPDARKILARVLVDSAPSDGEGLDRLMEAEKLYQGLVEEEKGDAETYMALAEVQVKKGDLALAAETLKKFRVEQPRSSLEIDLRLADILRRSGRLDESIALLREVAEEYPGQQNTTDTLGKTLEDAGRYEEAVEVWKDLAEQNPRNPYPHYRLGKAFLTLGRYADAQAPLLAALRGDPNNVGLFIALGQAYEGAGELEPAEESYLRALQRDDGSLESRFYLARIHQTRGQDDLALARYREILERTVDRKNLLPDRAYYVLANSQVGMIHYLHKRYPAAIVALEESLAASDRPADDIYLLLGRAYLANEQTEESLQLVREGQVEYPDNVGLMLLEGEILLESGKEGRARKKFKHALKGLENSEFALLEIVRACLRAEVWPEAEYWMKRARVEKPDSTEVQFQSAALLERMGKFEEAEKAFRDLLLKEPENSQVLNYLGYMLADRGIKLEEALTLLLQAVELEPENAAYLDSLGWAYFRLGRYEEAEDFIRRSAEGSRNDPVIYDHLGDILAKREKWQQAKEAYRIALDHLPDNPEEILQKIKIIDQLAEGS